MAPDRHLPKKINPLLVENIPPYESLVNRRRLGQTDLGQKVSQEEGTDAKKPRYLGTLEYAHLRVPLPKHVISGIFDPAPPSYFLMRRSHDGYVSATGMFKATFPWAEMYEEEMERKYIKSLESTSPDETAGNIWIPPLHALELAEEYHISTWIKALLDNSPIEINPSSKDSTPKTITPPPKFLGPHEKLGTTLPIGRTRRSASPSKITSPSKPTSPSKTTSPSKIVPPKKSAASPQKPKAAKSGASDVSSNSPTKKSSMAAKRISSMAARKIPLEDRKVDAEGPSTPGESPEVVRVTVDTDVLDNGDKTETTRTHVKVEIPAGLPDLPLPNDAETMIATAKEMVQAAVKADGAAVRTGRQKSKRKADVVADEEQDTEEAGPAAKKAKADLEAAVTLKKEIVKKRTLIGISATLAIGALVPYVFGGF